MLNVNQFQSPNAHNMGILISCKSCINNPSAVFPSLWTTSTVAIRAQVTLDTSPCFIIGHYSQPNQNSELDEELSFIVKLVKKRYNNPNIVVAGDFNRNK